MRLRPLSLVFLPLALIVWPLTPLRGQDNAFDLRFVELNSHRHLTYQNFIYVRSLANGSVIAQANFLRIPPGYDEWAAALGVRAAMVGEVSVYALAGFGVASDANYFEPAILLQDTKGPLTGALYLQRYQPVNRAGVGQWLLDMLEVQYAVRAPFYLGGVLYAYQPEGNTRLTKVGPKVGVNDRFGSTEMRIGRANRAGSPEIQLRRILLF